MLVFICNSMGKREILDTFSDFAVIKISDFQTCFMIVMKMPCHTEHPQLITAATRVPTMHLNKVTDLKQLYFSSKWILKLVRLACP